MTLRLGARACAAIVAAVVVFTATALPTTANATTLTATVSSTRWAYERNFYKPPIIDPPVTVTATGGTAPYSCSWQKVGGDPIQTAESPNSCSTRWLRPLNHVHHTFYCEAGWVAIVTDALGATTTTPMVIASFEWELGD